MGSMCNAPKAPPAPDPTVVSNAQAQANIASATAQQKLNMINTTGPTGSVNYVADEAAPGGYRQVTALSQPEQQTYDLSKQAENGALTTANTQLGRVNDALATPLSTAGLPELRGAANGGAIQTSVGPSGQIQTSFDKGQPLQYSFDPGQQVQGQVGPQDLYGAMRQAQDASYAQAQARLDPRFSQDENALRTRLANQGLSQNSDAYQTALQNFQQGKNDAYSQAQQVAVGQGNTAEQQLFGQALNQGQFANQAAAQMYGQNQGQAAFHNAAAGQDYGQNLGAANFANAAQQQLFAQNLASMQAANAAQGQGFQQDTSNAQLGNTARNQGLQERAYIQNQPINQFTGLLGLGQVGTPQGVQYAPSQVGQTDVTGAYALQVQAQQAAAQRAAQQQSGLMSGLFTLGAAAMAPATGGASLMAASDRRLKRDVVKIGQRSDGLRVYLYRYLWSSAVHVGVMAQEVLKVKPEAVFTMKSGFLGVDYGRL